MRLALPVVALILTTSCIARLVRAVDPETDHGWVCEVTNCNPWREEHYECERDARSNGGPRSIPTVNGVLVDEALYDSCMHSRNWMPGDEERARRQRARPAAPPPGQPTQPSPPPPV